MKILIAQPRIIFGGRIKVLLGITSALNELGFQPIWFTSRMPGSKQEISEKYKSNADFDIQLRRFRFSYEDEFGRARFNKIASKWANRNHVDWLINSSNSVAGFNTFENTISYVHFPREARVHSPLGSIHDPNSTCRFYHRRYYRKRWNRLAFWKRLDANHRIIANSEFTLAQWHAYNRRADLSFEPVVIYPFADDPRLPLPDTGSRRNIIVSLGRFCPAKRQLEQVKLATNLPDHEVWLIGHSPEKNRYLDKIRSTIKAGHIPNVSVFPNLGFSAVSEKLRSAKYFLHTNINEPFGITTVEAILAGSLPIVHNSGGQKEIVPFPELRFDEIEEIPGILAGLEKDTETRIRMITALREHALEHAVARVFKSRFKDYFIEATAGCS